jgi:hypothetical protein
MIVKKMRRVIETRPHENSVSPETLFSCGTIEAGTLATINPTRGMANQPSRWTHFPGGVMVAS